MMSDEQAKAIGAVSNMGKVLIERFSDALGGALNPWQRKRVARGEVEADIIREVGKLKIDEIRHRAFIRMAAEEGYKQENIEDILHRAILLLNDGARPTEIKTDWIMNFIDKSKLVSDEQMQELWARILAGEANSPGRFSRRTVIAVSSLDGNDAEFFSRLCRFSWSIRRELQPLIFDIEADVYKSNKLYFSTLMHLRSIGFLEFDHLTGYRMKNFPSELNLVYQKRLVDMTFSEGAEHTLDVGHVMLTTIGKELATVVSVDPVEGFFEYVCNYYTKKGIIISDPVGS